MHKNTSLPPRLTLSVSLVLLLIGLSAHAQTATWTNVATTGSWTNQANWFPNVVPNGIDAVANLTATDLTAQKIISLDGSKTVGAIYMDDTVPANNVAGQNYLLRGGTNIFFTLQSSSGLPPIVSVSNVIATATSLGMVDNTLQATLAGTNGLRKIGPGRWHLTNANYTGVTYLDEGALRLINSPNGFGFSKILVKNGAQAYLSFGNGTITNDFWIEGIGVAETTPGWFFGAIRVANAITILRGTITLTDDARISARGGAGVFMGQITETNGSHTLQFNYAGDSATALVTLTNVTASPNDWSGDTVIASGGAVRLGLNEQIPNGPGKGNLIITNSWSTTLINSAFDLMGKTETVNGLFAVGPDLTRCIVSNSTAAAGTIIIGDNNATSTFGGWLRGNFNIAKIGSGTLTLRGSSTIYNGNTTVSAGTLALAGPAAIANSGTFSISNSALTLLVNPARTNISVTSLTPLGTTNFINISGVAGISSYPTQFTLIKYTGAIGGVGHNFGIGTVPNASTGGYISNDIANSRLVLVLTNGPSPITWRGNDGTNPTYWDVATTPNWLNGASPSVFGDSDTVLIDDLTGLTNVLSLQGTVQPSGLTVSNSTRSITFTGSGAISSGFAGLTKLGSGTLTLLQTGPDSFNGGLSVSNGRVVLARDNFITDGATIAPGAALEIGTNGGSGSLPSGTVVNDGTLVFNRGADLIVVSPLFGNGSIIKTNAGLLALNANNSFTGTVSVVGGTLRIGNAGALGAIGSGTLVTNATLDVNGFNVGQEPITISGAGIGNNGAIVNNSGNPAFISANVARVILANDTTFGGTGRWDLRSPTVTDPAGSSLNSSNLPYMLTKVGTNMVTIVGTTVDPALGHVNILQGTLALESATTGLGNTGSNLVVAAGATLQLFNLSTPLNKVISLTGNGTNNTVNNASGNCSIIGAITVSGDTVFNAAAGQLAVSSSIGGGGGLVKSGPGRLVFDSAGTFNYTGATVVNAGSLIVAGSKSGGAGLTVGTNGLLGGATVSEPVTVNGTLSPGNPVGTALQTLTVNGDVAMNSSTNILQLSTSPFGGNDLVQVNGNLTLSGTNTMRIIIANYLTVGDTYTLVNYTGAGTLVDTNHILVTAPFGYEFQLLDPTAPANTNKIQILVTQALGFDQWTGAINGNWDVNTTANWLKNGLGSVFTNSDIANFLEVPTPSTTNVNIVGTVSPSGIYFTNFFLTYQLSGTGRISGSNGMWLAGGAPVYIENSGGNDFSGTVMIDGDNPDGGGLTPQLYVGHGGTSGDLGPGPVTNNAALIIYRTGTVTLSNNIAGRGVITNLGTGVATLSGAPSTFSGDVFISAGTLRAGSATAFGAAATNGAPALRPGATFVANGATYDINGNNIGSEQLYVVGGGVNTNGAIVNNSTNAQTSALRFVMLGSDITIGGTARWDIRTDGVLLTDPVNSPYKITKVGTNQISLVAVTNIDPMLGDIDIKEGVFAIQTTTMQVGNPNNTITVYTNGTLNEWNLTALMLNKKVVMQHGGAFWTENGNTTNLGPVTIQGSNTFWVQGTRLAFLSNSISGPGTIHKIGGGELLLAGTNLYTGNTIISNGTVTLTGNTALTNSPVIDLSGTTNTPVIDVNGRVDGTLTLRSGQTLKGAGLVRGSVSVSAGATITPGHSIGTLSVSNTLTLSGSQPLLMELDAGNNTSDSFGGVAGVNNTVNLAGTLTVTNLNGTLSAGQTFQLFSATNIAGSFSSVTLPPLGNTVLLYWTNRLTTDGTISVVSRPQPKFLNILVFDGTNIVVYGGSTNGVLTGNYRLLASTNVAAPLSGWAIIATNSFTGGTFSFTNPMSPFPIRFFTVQPLP